MGLDDLFESMGHNKRHHGKTQYDERYDEHDHYKRDNPMQGHPRKESSMTPMIKLFLERLQSDRKLQLLLAFVAVVALLCFTIIIIILFKMLGGAAGFLSSKNLPSNLLEWVRTFLPILGK